MKLIYKLLVGLLLAIMLSCSTTPEQRIIKEIKRGGMFNAQITELNVTDTIYEKHISDIMLHDYNAIDSLVVRIMKNASDSIKFHYTQHEKFWNDERLLNFYQHRYTMLMMISNQDTNTMIRGYFVRIQTDRDTMDFVVSDKYKMIGPKFMFTNENPETIQRGRRPETFGPRGQNKRGMGKPERNQGRMGRPSPPNPFDRIPL